jgi:hypothetical protein
MAGVIDGRDLGLASRHNVIEKFDHFRAELDEHNDRRERLIKVRFLPDRHTSHFALTHPRLVAT